MNNIIGLIYIFHNSDDTFYPPSVDDELSAGSDTMENVEQQININYNPQCNPEPIEELIYSEENDDNSYYYITTNDSTNDSNAKDETKSNFYH